MNDISDSIVERTASSDCSLPPNIYAGLFGWLHLSPKIMHTDTPVQTRQHGETMHWKGEGFALSLRGEGQHFASANGWLVFVLGAANCAQRVARILAHG